MFVFIIGPEKSNYCSTAQYFLLTRKERKRNCRAMETALKVYKNRMQKIPTSKLNEVMQKAIRNKEVVNKQIQVDFIFTNSSKVKYVQLKTYNLKLPGSQYYFIAGVLRIAVIFCRNKKRSRFGSCCGL
jgi:predicted GTPase